MARQPFLVFLVFLGWNSRHYEKIAARVFTAETLEASLAFS
jgi:hypothetical protein